MAEDAEEIDEERERILRMARFAGLFIMLMFMWYGFGLADVV